MTRRRTQKDGHILLDITDPAKARAHLRFLADVVTHSYGKVDGEIELNFLEDLIEQLDKEEARTACV